MLRISEIESGNGWVVLKLEGSVVGPWVEELRKACETLREREKAVKLDMNDVSYVDRSGVVLLLGLRRQNVLLEGCSPFVTEELKEADVR